MYNKLLDTFNIAADRGSFSRAAEELFLTPSAVNQQMQSLEQMVGGKLFERTNHGVTLTEAGRYLRSQTDAFIQAGNAICRHTAAIAKKDTTVFIGTSISNCFDIRLLFTLWQMFAAQNPGVDCRLVDYMDTTPNAPVIGLLEGFYSTLPFLTDYRFERIGHVPLGFAVARTNPLSVKDSVTPEELQPYLLLADRNLLLSEPATLPDFLRAQGFNYKLTDQYGPTEFWNTGAYNDVLLCPECFAFDLGVHAKYIHCDWELRLPYGIYVRKNASPLTERFLAFCLDRIRNFEVGDYGIEIESQDQTGIDSSSPNSQSSIL